MIKADLNSSSKFKVLHIWQIDNQIAEKEGKRIRSGVFLNVGLLIAVWQLLPCRTQNCGIFPFGWCWRTLQAGTLMLKVLIMHLPYFTDWGCLSAKFSLWLSSHMTHWYSVLLIQQESKLLLFPLSLSFFGFVWFPSFAECHSSGDPYQQKPSKVLHEKTRLSFYFTICVLIPEWKRNTERKQAL